MFFTFLSIETLDLDPDWYSAKMLDVVPDPDQDLINPDPKHRIRFSFT
jgi:hypothetical protein